MTGRAPVDERGRGYGMSMWSVEVTVRTTRRVDGPTVAAVLADATACRAVLSSPGVPGASVLLCVEAPTGAGAYSAALVLLIADVLPRLEGATLIDVRITTGEQPAPRTDGAGSAASAAGRSGAPPA